MPKQSVNQVTVKTGGKLYIAGEYSVLTPGQTALIQFIPIFMSAEVKEAPSTQLSSDMFDYSVSREPDANYALIQEGRLPAPMIIILCSVLSPIIFPISS